MLSKERDVRIKENFTTLSKLQFSFGFLTQWSNVIRKHKSKVAVTNASILESSNKV